MRLRFMEACQSFQWAEKACWEILLRELPEVEALPAETLDAAMDRTLSELWALVRTGSVKDRLTAMKASPPPLPTQHECGLMSLLPYFNAGERALELILGEVERAHPHWVRPEARHDREELCAAFGVLVQCHLEAACRRCALGGKCRYGDYKAVAELPRASASPGGSPALAPTAKPPLPRSRTKTRRPRRSP